MTRLVLPHDEHDRGSAAIGKPNYSASAAMADHRASSRKAPRPKTSRGARDLSLYAGQECIGRIKVAGDGKAVAFDRHGKRIGSFPSLKAACAAIRPSVRRTGARRD
jgi:hypothetical protein